jgi:ATP-dependent Clp protease adapter protein ClpS
MSPDGRRGYFRIVTLGGIPISIHWSFPVVGLLCFAFLVRFDVEVAAYCGLGYLIVIGAHELGHVAAARWSGLRVFAVDISAVGGLCRGEGPHTIRAAFLFYSAGLLAQFLLLILTLCYVAVCGFPASVPGGSLVATFTLLNLVLLIANLLPGHGSGGVATDGSFLWKLSRRDAHTVLAPRDTSPIFSPDTRLLSLDGFRPDDFVTGIEVLNDHTTPADFVVDALMKHLPATRKDAVELMLATHERGGLLIPLPSLEKAALVARLISSEAREHGHALVCRAVRVDLAE